MTKFKTHLKNVLPSSIRSKDSFRSTPPSEEGWCQREESVVINYFFIHFGILTVKLCEDLFDLFTSNVQSSAVCWSIIDSRTTCSGRAKGNFVQESVRKRQLRYVVRTTTGLV